MPHSEIHADDLRVVDYDVLVSPGLLRQEHPLSDRAKATILKARNAAIDVIDGQDDRVLVIVGPCSIHDAAQGLEVSGCCCLRNLLPGHVTIMLTPP